MNACDTVIVSDIPEQRMYDVVYLLYFYNNDIYFTFGRFDFQMSKSPFQKLLNAVLHTVKDILMLP